MTKILTLQNLRVWGDREVSRLNVVKTLNIGPHTHVELFVPSLELMTIFGKIWSKLANNRVGQFGGLKHPYIF